MSLWKDFSSGIIKENPVLRLMIGLCPTIATTTSAINALGMSAATAFVLIGSNLLVSIVRKIVPDEIRIPIFILIIASLVTVTDYVMYAFMPALHKSLGVFIPLIVANCIILGRSEAFAYKNPVLNSVLDGVGMSIGFTLSLTTIGIIREILGSGSVFGISFINSSFMATAMVLTPGAFMTVGFVMALLNRFEKRAQ